MGDVFVPFVSISRAKEEVFMGFVVASAVRAQSCCVDFCLSMVSVDWQPLVNELLYDAFVIPF